MPSREIRNIATHTTVIQNLLARTHWLATNNTKNSSCVTTILLPFEIYSTMFDQIVCCRFSCKLALNLFYALFQFIILLLKIYDLFFESLGLFTQNSICWYVCDKLDNAHGVS